MRNLKEETIEVLAENGKTENDVLWVGTEDYKIPTELFWELADREYDDGYGSQEVAIDLLVVGNGWWLERHEYDGSEWWEFKSMPAEPNETRTVKRVISRYWETLDNMQERKKDEADRR